MEAQDIYNSSVNEVSLFDHIQKQVVLDNPHETELFPSNNIDGDGPIEIEINGSPMEMIDLNNIMLIIQAKITNRDNNDLIAADVVAPRNNWLHTMFSDVMLTVENTVVEGGEHKYPFKAYLSNLLIHNRNSKNTQLRSSLWLKDTAQQMNSGGAINTGFTQRRAAAAESATVEMCGPILLDFFLQNKYLLQNTKMTLKFSRSKPEFQVGMYTAGTVANRARAVKVKILKASLYMRQVKATASYIAEIEDKLNYQNAIYPIQRTVIDTFTIPAGSQSHNKQSLFNGRLPKLVVVALLRNDAYNGAYDQNPFNFHHHNVNEVALYSSSGQVLSPLKPDFANNCFMHSYMSLYRALNQFNQSDDFDITTNEYANGYSLYAFNLTPDLHIVGHAQTFHDGQLRLEIKFANATAVTLNVLVLGVFDGRVDITKTRNVLCDWKS